MRWRERWCTWPKSPAVGWRPFARAPRKNGPATAYGSRCRRDGARRAAAAPQPFSAGPSRRAACWAIPPTPTTWRWRHPWVAPPRRAPGRRVPPALREVAELRLAHPRAGLRELAELAQVSKSAVANRLRRLVAQANRNGLIDHVREIPQP